MFVVLVTGLRHGSFLIIQSNFILFTSFHPLRWASIRFVHFSRFSQCRLPTFQLACFIVRAAVNGRLFLLTHNQTEKINTPIALVLSVVWHRLMQRFFAFATLATGVAPAFVVASSSFRAAHPHSTRRWLAAHRIANHFIPFHCTHYLQPQPSARRGRFYLN